MSNQSNYAHEKFRGDIKGSFKNKKKYKKLNVDYGRQYGIHLYTSVHCKGNTHIQCLSSLAAHSVIYVSFPSLSLCGHFHGYFHLQLSQSQVKSQDEHTSFWFALLMSYSTKCSHLLCWCSQNTRGCTSML